MSSEWMLKLAEAYKKIEEFENAYLSPKSVFNLMHTVGITDEQETIELNARYDHTMEPFRKKTREIQKVIYDRTKEIVLPFIKTDDDKR